MKTWYQRIQTADRRDLECRRDELEHWTAAVYWILENMPCPLPGREFPSSSSYASC